MSKNISTDYIDENNEKEVKDSAEEKLNKKTVENEEFVEHDSFTDEDIDEELKKSSEKAKKILEDPDKLEELLQKIEKKLKKIPKIGRDLAKIPLLVSLTRAYIKKEYTALPIGIIMAIVGSLIYFASPIDLIPDIIPGAGYIDDAAVILAMLKLCGDDVEEFREWQVENGKRRT